jgi:hypothetical protein
MSPQDYPDPAPLTIYQRARLRVTEALASSYSAKVLARQLAALGLDCKAEGVCVVVEAVMPLSARTAHHDQVVKLQHIANQWSCSVLGVGREKKLVCGEELEDLLTERIFEVDFLESDYFNVSALIEAEEIPDPYFWYKATGHYFRVDGCKVSSSDGHISLKFNPRCDDPKRRWTGTARQPEQILSCNAEVIDILCKSIKTKSNQG